MALSPSKMLKTIMKRWGRTLVGPYRQISNLARLTKNILFSRYSKGSALIKVISTMVVILTRLWLIIKLQAPLY